MNTKSKYILIGSALLVAATGTALAFNGYGNCYQNGPGMQGGNPYNQVQGNMRGMRPMNWRQGVRGQRQTGYMKPSPMRGIYRLNNLTSEQLQQLDTIRQAQQEWRSGQQVAKQAHRDEMRSKVDAILTEKQRQTLNRWRPANN